MMLLINAERACVEVQYPLVIKALIRLENPGTYTNIRKAMLHKRTVSAVAKRGRRQAFVLKRRMKPVSSLHFHAIYCLTSELEIKSNGTTTIIPICRQHDQVLKGL